MECLVPPLSFPMVCLKFLNLAQQFCLMFLRLLDASKEFVKSNQTLSCLNTNTIGSNIMLVVLRGFHKYQGSSWGNIQWPT